jgi:hypothetical protein
VNDVLEYFAYGLLFRKMSGAYVDVWFQNDSGAPFTNIGIWDYATNKSTVNTCDELVTVAEKWWAEGGRDDIGKYLEGHVG